MKPNEIYNLYKVGDWITVGDDVQYKFYLDDEAKKIYVVYQCSTSDRDWKNNFKFLSKFIKIGDDKFMAHRGFVNAFLSAKEEIFNELAVLRNFNPSYDIVMSGHSFGGAMSKLSALYFHDEFGIKADIVTFGSPKVILTRHGVKLARKHIDKMFNYANYNDFISYMPPYYSKLEKVRVGEKFSIFKVFKDYHTNYGDLDYTDYPQY